MPGSGIGTERRTNLVTVLIAFVTLVIGVLGVAAIGSERDVARDADLIALDEASEPADSGDTESAARGSSAEVAHDHDAEATADDEHAHDTVDGAATAGAHADGHAHAVTADSTSDGTDAHAHSHDPTPAAPGSPPTTHGNHQHPADTTPTSAGTPPTTHDPNAHPHDPPVTVPGQPTTPTTTGHSHSGSNVQLIDLPADIQAQVRSATQWAVQYDTTAKASQAGFGQTTSYFPGIAAHYGDTGRIFDRSAGFDPSVVDVLLFNGTGPDAELVGINYIVYSGAQPPEGFPGAYDEWHEHPMLCLRGAIVVSEAPTAQGCIDRGLAALNMQGFWLLHVWSIAGWEAPEGIFAHANSRV